MEPKSRRIPMDEGFMSYKVDDILYGFISVQATFNTTKKELYVTADKMLAIRNEYYKLCARSITKRTIKNRVDKFIADGYIKQQTDENGNIYYVMAADSLEWEIIDYNLLKYLVATRNQQAVKLYCYLLKKYKWKKLTNEMYSFTIRELCLALGYSESSASSGPFTSIISMIVESFEKEGLIKTAQYYEDKAPRIRLTFVQDKREVVKDE